MLQSHRFRHLEHVSEGEHEVRDTEMVCFIDHKGFHSLFVVIPQSGHLFLHVVEERDDCEKCFRVNQQNILVYKCFVGLIGQREEPSIHADEAFDEWRHLFLLD